MLGSILLPNSSLMWQKHRLYDLSVQSTSHSQANTVKSTLTANIPVTANQVRFSLKWDQPKESATTAEESNGEQPSKINLDPVTSVEKYLKNAIPEFMYV